MDHKKMWDFRWLFIFGSVLFVIGGLQVCRVNHQPVEEKPIKPAYTRPGPLVEEVLAVPPQNFLSFPIHINRRMLLRGKFWTGAKEHKIACIVLSSENFEAWKTGLEYKSLTGTGLVPGGRIHRVLEPGEYILIFDSRHSVDARNVEASFVLE